MRYTTIARVIALYFCLFLAAICLSACTINHQETRKFNYVWYVGMEFEPGSTEFLDGLSVSDVDPDLKYVRVLSMADVPDNVPEPDRPANNGHYFHLLQDIDSDGVAEDINVGVYEDKSGENGRFILISNNGNVEYFRKHPGPADFSILCTGRDNTVLWAYCMNCDAYDTISWSGESYEIELYDGSSFH